MRKNVFLTLLIALFSVATAWAEFNPTPGVKYALQEKSSGLYLDIQTLGSNESEGTDNISLSSAPCAIYFEWWWTDEWGVWWKMKNEEGKYVFTHETLSWNPIIGDTPKGWNFVEDGNFFKINSWQDFFIVGDEKEEGHPLFVNNESVPLQFSLVDFVEQTQSYTFYIIDAPQGVNVTYNGQAITEGATIEGTFDRDLFATENIEGYTWDVEVDEVNKTVTLVYTEVVEGGGKLNGYYHISYNGNPVFIGYNAFQNDNGTAVGSTADGEGYKLIATGTYQAEAEGDKVFAIFSNGEGYTISAQGKYLKSPNFTWWNHVMFSDNEEEAGVYVFNDGVNLADVKIQALCENPNEWTHNDYLQVYDPNSIVANNPFGAASRFTLTRATRYAVSEGMTTLYLPFNVVLPEGVVAYDIVNADEEALESGENLLEEIAVAGDILLAGTPVVLDAEAATSLTITTNSSGAKGAAQGSLLRGSFVKHTLGVGTSKKYVLNGGKFEPVTITTEMPANSCWVVTEIEDENAGIEPGHIMIDGWEFTYTEKENGRITLEDCVSAGEPNLVIGSEYVVNGVKKTVVAISPEFLRGDTILESVTIPATMANLGFREIEPMFSGSYEGKPGNYGVFNGSNLVEGKGYNEHYDFPDNPESTPLKPYLVDGTFAWRLTLDVTIDPTKSISFNNYGSAIVSSKDNSLDDSYAGYMQIYLWKDLQHIVVKIDNSDDRYMYTLPVLDANGVETGELVAHTHFKFELEHDGAGGYQVVIYYDDGRAKMYAISAEQGKLLPFDKLYYSLPEGIHVDVKFDRLISYGLFVGCANLKEIIVDPANPTFKSCEHGVLYDKNGFYVMRIPEGGGHHEGEKEGTPAHFEIPSKVVRLYAGSIHDVNADIVLHSNPEIGVVEGHEHHVENARFFLSLDDKDTSIKEGETGYGGARDFISTNNNTYVAANYKRAPLEKDMYGTIVLPFVATNWKEKYDFFEMTAADATSFHFSPVDELEDQKAYLYKLKDGIEPEDEMMEMEDGLDVFKTEAGAPPFTVKTHAKYNPNDEKPGGFRALGAYVNHYIETVNYPNSAYYYYSVSEKNFIKVTRKLTYRPYRAIFVVTPKEESQAAQAPARFGLRILKRDGTTTEIDPSQVEGMEEPIYYDLQGRRVENPTQGIYIVNGKKVVIE